MIRSATSRVSFESTEGFWSQPLGYAHAFITVMMALTLGLAFHVWVGYEVLTAFPPIWVAVAALSPLLVLAIAARRMPGNGFVRWMTGIPFAMVSTSSVVLIALVGGIIPAQTIAERFGIASIWGSWPFLFAGFLMMLNLVGSCGRRCLPLNYTNVVYLMSHLGLAVALMGGVLSSITLERHTMVLFKGVPAKMMTDRHEREWKAPFSVTLRDFRMDTFPPTAVYAKISAGGHDGVEQVAGEHFLKAGLTEKVGPTKVEVLQHLSHAAFDGKHWREVAWKTAAPAAKVRATLADGTSREGWISCGSPDTMPAYLMLSDTEAILMSSPRPKKFESTLEIDGKTMDVGVNKPLHVRGWDVYQYSYDEKLGPASQYSVVELVQDRGLPVVYTGIFAMLFGAMLHLWNGIGGKK